MTELTGNAIQPAETEGTKSFNSFLNLLEDGQFHADLSAALRELNAKMNDIAMENNGKCTGQLNVKLKLKLDKGVFEIVPDFTTSMTKLSRPRTIAWSTPGNNFSAQNPRQMTLFEKPREAAVAMGEIKSAY